MQRTVLAGVILGLLATTAPSAHATPDYHWRGGCGLAVFNDTTPTGLLGGRKVWNGEVDILAVATNEMSGLPTPLASIHVDCKLRINNVLGPTILSASGGGVAVNAGQVTFTADVTDYVEICDVVTVQTDVHQPVCYQVTTLQNPPQPVLDLFYALWDPIKYAVDPTVCAVFGTLAPGIPPLVVDPSGDIILLGEVMYDCPPYYDHGPQYWPWPLYVMEHHHI